MSASEAARQFFGHLGSVLVVWVIAVGGAYATMTAWRGRPAYWLGTAGAVLVVFGFLWGPGFLPSSLATTAIGIGIALAIFAVALDLMLGPAHVAPIGRDEETIDPRFE